MEYWVFTRPETWTRLTAATPLWEEGEDDETCMRRLGYRFVCRACNSDDISFFGAWSLWRMQHVDDIAYQYCVFLDTLGDGALACVWIPTTPDLMVYMTKYGNAGCTSCPVRLR